MFVFDGKSMVGMEIKSPVYENWKVSPQAVYEEPIH